MFFHKTDKFCKTLIKLKDDFMESPHLELKTRPRFYLIT